MGEFRNGAIFKVSFPNPWKPFLLGFCRNHCWNKAVATKGKKKQIFFCVFEHPGKVMRGSKLEFCSLFPIFLRRRGFCWTKEQRGVSGKALLVGFGHFPGTGILQQSVNCFFSPLVQWEGQKLWDIMLDFVYFCERLQVVLFAPDKSKQFELGEPKIPALDPEGWAGFS